MPPFLRRLAPALLVCVTACDDDAAPEAPVVDARLGQLADTATIPVADLDPPGPLDAGLDAAPPDADAAPPDADADAAPADAARQPDARVIACGEFSARARGAVAPVDIVWLVDASPSMDEEIALIEANLNAFAARIGASGLDYRVVMVGSDADQCADGRCYFGICVPPPLSGAPGCPDTDGERYRHVRAPIHSREALDVAVAQLDAIGGFLRDGVTTHLVAVTDDDVGFGLDADEFLAAVAGAMPDLVVHRARSGWRSSRIASTSTSSRPPETGRRCSTSTTPPAARGTTPAGTSTTRSIRAGCRCAPGRAAIGRATSRSSSAA